MCAKSLPEACGFSGMGRESGKALAVALFVVVLAVGCLAALDGSYGALLLRRERDMVRTSLSGMATSLGNAVNRRFSLLKGVQAFVEIGLSGPGNGEAALARDFDAFAAGLYASTPGVRNFVAAPGGINTYVYPLERNRKALGHDILHDKRPQVRKDVERTVRTRRVAISGPYELRQGGLGLVARNAVYDGERLWGLVSMVVDVPPVLSEAGLGANPERVRMALLDNRGEVFHGEADVAGAAPVRIDVPLPEGRWTLAGVPAGGWGAGYALQRWTFRGLGLAVALLLGLAAYLLAYRHAWLAVAVSERTGDLGRANDQLRQENARRAEAEREASRSRGHLQNIVDFMPSVIVGVDARGRVDLWNKQAERVAGVRSADALGRPLADAWPRLARDREGIARAMETNDIQQHARREVLVDGAVRYEDVTIYPFGEGGETSAVLRIDDITDRVRTETAMVQAEKMMSLGGLAAGMAHEINNPLGGILQSVQNIVRRLDPGLPANQESLVRHGIAPDALVGYVQERRIASMLGDIRQAGERTARIITSLLGFGRAQDPEKNWCEIARLVDETIALVSMEFDLARGFDFRNIEIARRYADNLPMVPCIGNLIQQVLMNLLRNAAQALHASPPRSGRPRITLGLAEEGGCIVVTVEDNGPGIGAEARKHIFDPFFTTKPPGAGTGLGLSMAYYLVAGIHGGIIEVDSKPGSWTRFTVRLPLSMSCAA